MFLRRSVAPPTPWNGAVYLGDVWRGNGGLQLTYGVRLETSNFGGAPSYNAVLDSVFGVRTDRIPSEIRLSPRAGFTWITGGGNPGDGRAGFGGTTTILRGGVGEFRSPTPTSLYSSALAAPGLSTAEARLVYIGSAVPIPDWADYLQDEATIPDQCESTATTVGVTPSPNATIFDPGFTSPRAWRASLGIQHRFLGTLSFSVDASYARGVSQYGFSDLNLVTSPGFTLPAEANRPVYVPIGDVIPATGAVSSTDSRVDSRFGQVIAIRSDLASGTRQVTAALNGITGRGASFQLSYTYTRAQDQSSFSGGGASQGFAAATTAGDPNLREWSPSSFERRHSFLATITFPITGSLEMTSIGRLSSGGPFTPLVGSDINGDGARNDRAFIFDPSASADTAVAGSMRSLLAAAPGNIRDCLEQQLGAVAGRNSCHGPWQPSLDFQINWRPTWFGLDRRLTVSVVTVNFLGGLDNLLHGSGNLHGWGSSTAPDPVLLYVRSFDPTTRQFIYSVNGRFGSTVGANSGIVTPFQIGFQGHFTIGPDPVRERLRSAFGSRGGNRGERGQVDASEFAAPFARVLPNPIGPILELRDSLRLSAVQVTELQALSDSVDLLNRTLSDSVQAEIERAGDRPDPSVLFARIRPNLTRGRERRRQAIARARELLTPEQWAKLPETVRARDTRRRRGN